MNSTVSRGVTSTGRSEFLYRDAADTADQVADVEQEPEMPGRPLGDLVQASDVTAR
jgi:hypothetical protein